MNLAKFFNHDFSSDNFRLYDNNGKKIYFEDSYGYWYKYEYDKNGNEVYYEDSDGNIRDNRPKCNGKTIIVDGIEYELVRKEK